MRVFEELVGPEQLLYGSDRPVVDPSELGMPEGLNWEPIEQCTRRALNTTRLAVAR